MRRLAGLLNEDSVLWEITGICHDPDLKSRLSPPLGGWPFSRTITGQACCQIRGIVARDAI
ncbi:hypothetical protein ABIC60_003424 [Phyllobacterium ifriqiyense]